MFELDVSKRREEEKFYVYVYYCKCQNQFFRSSII